MLVTIVSSVIMNVPLGRDVTEGGTMLCREGGTWEISVPSSLASEPKNRLK